LQWIAEAIERVKKFAHKKGIVKAQAQRERLTQLRGTLALAECLLQQHPKDQFLKNAQIEAQQELAEKEIKKANWDALRSSAC